MKGSNIQMKIQFVNRQNKSSTRVWQALIREVLSSALPVIASTGMATVNSERLLIQDMPAEPSVTVTFAGPIVMRRINRETRGVDQLTDVLSYPLLDCREGRLLTMPGPQDFEHTANGWLLMPLGDIVIAPEKAKQQALAYGHSMAREMAFLAVHGLLHLLGYDHEKPEQEATMLHIQEAVLTEAGYSRIQPDRL